MFVADDNRSKSAAYSEHDIQLLNVRSSVIIYKIIMILKFFLKVIRVFIHFIAYLNYFNSMLQ